MAQESSCRKQLVGQKLVIEEGGLETTEAIVNALSQFLTGFEMRDILAIKIDTLTGFGVSTDTRLTKVKTEAAKAANFNALARRQSIDHVVNDTLHRQLDVFGRELDLSLCDSFYKLGFGHLWFSCRTAQDAFTQ